MIFGFGLEIFALNPFLALGTFVLRCNSRLHAKHKFTKRIQSSIWPRRWGAESHLGIGVSSRKNTLEDRTTNTGLGERRT